MEQTKEMKQIIAQIIQDIQEQQSYRAVEAGDDVRVPRRNDFQHYNRR